ncbi:MAG: hypothetical protein IV088_07250 [Hydrogenophaga sp.]|jgi:hypothetical protein|uniref:hypothetical protein n=1 Tax=Hydrogenophaga sp. TaxID=1904254 RepID=UPI0025C3CD41|nr:hypothetical protein [Hydrogenophaga sp.]MBT9550625.1 hypothetical protein [Hydrogenophaga sp.]
MKPFLPFLLVPVLGLGGWGLSALAPSPDPLVMPSVLSLDAPPALGVALPPPPGDGPVPVSLEALLPMAESEVVQLAAEQPPPEVSAILVIGRQRLAQINGTPMVIGESLGDFRIADIEADRVLFVQTSMGHQRWVPLNDR